MGSQAIVDSDIISNESPARGEYRPAGKCALLLKAHTQIFWDIFDLLFLTKILMAHINTTQYKKFQRAENIIICFRKVYFNWNHGRCCHTGQMWTNVFFGNINVRWVTLLGFPLFPAHFLIDLSLLGEGTVSMTFWSPHGFPLWKQCLQKTEG